MSRVALIARNQGGATSCALHTGWQATCATLSVLKPTGVTRVPFDFADAVEIGNRRLSWSPSELHH